MTVSNDLEKERLAKLLKEVRGNRSQRFYAKLLKVSYTTIQDWEGCRSFPDEDNLKNIAASAGWSLPELEQYLSIGEKPAKPSFEMLLS